MPFKQNVLRSNSRSCPWWTWNQSKYSASGSDIRGYERQISNSTDARSMMADWLHMAHRYIPRWNTSQRSDVRGQGTRRFPLRSIAWEVQATTTVSVWASILACATYTSAYFLSVSLGLPFPCSVLVCEFLVYVIDHLGTDLHRYDNDSHVANVSDTNKSGSIPEVAVHCFKNTCNAISCYWLMKDHIPIANYYILWQANDIVW